MPAAVSFIMSAAISFISQQLSSLSCQQFFLYHIRGCVSLQYQQPPISSDQQLFPLYAFSPITLPAASLIMFEGCLSYNNHSSLPHHIRSCLRYIDSVIWVCWKMPVVTAFCLLHTYFSSPVTIFLLLKKYNISGISTALPHPVTTTTPEIPVSQSRPPGPSTTTSPVSQPQTSYNEEFLTQENVIQAVSNLPIDKKKKIGFSAFGMLLDCQFAGKQCFPR